MPVQEYHALIIIHQIFSLACDWSKYVTRWNLSQLNLDLNLRTELTVFLELRSWETVRFSEQIMSKDKYPSIFSRQMEPIVYLFNYFVLGGAVASWLVCSTPERAVRIRALAGDIVLCSCARHFTLTVPLSIQVYKWVPANCWRNLTRL